MMRLSRLFEGKLEILHQGALAAGCAVIHKHHKLVHRGAVALLGSMAHLNALANFMHSDVHSCRVSLFCNVAPSWREAIVNFLSPDPVHAACLVCMVQRQRLQQASQCSLQTLL